MVRPHVKIRERGPAHHDTEASVIDNEVNRGKHGMPGLRKNENCSLAFAPLGGKQAKQADIGGGWLEQKTDISSGLPSTWL